MKDANTSDTAQTSLPSDSLTATRPHYLLLDALRGVAALLVVWYHTHEGFAFAAGEGVIGGINHGYLAVDFFFILSGFVIGYAYDGRWGKGFGPADFFKRRLFRLHPMVIMGAFIGFLCFAVSGFARWDGTGAGLAQSVVAMLCSLILLPALPGMQREVRGNGEMFPLNGPCWSLFFEYIGNIVYALLLRRFSTRILIIVTGILGAGLAWFCISDPTGFGCLSVGWTLDGINFLGGLLRMLFPMTMGLLLSRVYKKRNVKHAMIICTLILIALFHVPYINSSNGVNLNGVFEAACIAIVFPFIVLLGASGEATSKAGRRVCTFLGNISYPLYIVHYPLMYLFYARLISIRKYTLGETWPLVLTVCLGSILLAWLCQRFYERPVRRWLRRRFMS